MDEEWDRMVKAVDAINSEAFATRQGWYGTLLNRASLTEFRDQQGKIGDFLDSDTEFSLARANGGFRPFKKRGQRGIG